MKRGVSEDRRLSFINVQDSEHFRLLQRAYYCPLFSHRAECGSIGKSI